MKRCFGTIFLLFLAGSLVQATEPAEQSGKLSEALGGKLIFEIRGSRNLNGSIKMIPQDEDRVDVSFQKIAGAESKSQEKLFLDLIDLKLTSETDRAVLSILTPSDSPWQGKDYHVSLDIIVQLPEKAKIEGNLQFMKIDVSGPFEGIQINSGFSEVSLAGINGPVDITTSFAPIILSDITGSIKAETRYGEIRAMDIKVPMGSAIFKNTGQAIKLSDIAGPVEAYNSYSPIEASDIDATEGTVVLRTSYSPIDVRDISGELICETSFSPIKVVDCTLSHGQSRFETSYSPIKAELSTTDASQLFIFNNYSNINLSIPMSMSTQLAASVDEGGRIHTTDLPLKPTYLDATRLEGKLGDGTGRIELKVSGIGLIDIEGR